MKPATSSIRRTALIATAAGLALSACKGGDPAKAGIAKPVEPAPAPAAAPAAEPAPPAGQRTLAQIDNAALKLAATELGWKVGGIGGMGMGTYDSTAMAIERDGRKARVTLVVPSGKPADPSSSMKIRSPRDQATDLERLDAATLVRDDAFIAVKIEGGRLDDNQTVLDGLVSYLNLAP